MNTIMTFGGWFLIFAAFLAGCYQTFRPKVPLKEINDAAEEMFLAVRAAEEELARARRAYEKLKLVQK